MSSQATRNKIWNAAVACFNQKGIANIRLQQIADEAGISIGNMTYHFRTKDDIVHHIWQHLEQEIRGILNEFRVLPLFEDIERLLRRLFALQQRFAFFYQDTLEVMRAYPEIHSEHRIHMDWQVKQIGAAIEFNCARGAFQSELLPEAAILRLAELFWCVADSWRYWQGLRAASTDDENAFLNDIWSVFLPYFTDMGRREFEQVRFLHALDPDLLGSTNLYNDETSLPD